MYDIIELNNKLVGELKEIAKSLNIPKYDAFKKQELIYKILDHQAINPPPEGQSKPISEEPRILRPRKIKLDNIDVEPKTKSTEEKSFFNDDDFSASVKSEENIEEIPALESSIINSSESAENTNKQENQTSRINEQVQENESNSEIEIGNRGNERRDNRNRFNNGRSNEQQFNFDGIISSEGVLESMPDGYGFLRSADYN